MNFCFQKIGTEIYKSKNSRPKKEKENKLKNFILMEFLSDDMESIKA